MRINVDYNDGSAQIFLNDSEVAMLGCALMEFQNIIGEKEEKVLDLVKVVKETYDFLDNEKLDALREVLTKVQCVRGE